MKSELILPEAEAEKPFPKIMKNNSGACILFTNKGVGLVIVSPDGYCWPVGSSGENWETSAFEDVPAGTKIVITT